MLLEYLMNDIQGYLIEDIRDYLMEDIRGNNLKLIKVQVVLIKLI